MKLLTYIFSFAYFLTLSPCLAGESGIAAIVNDKSILNSDLTHRVNLLIKSSQSKVSPEMLKDLRKQVLQQMIDEILQQQLLVKYEIKVEGPEIDEAWASYEQRLGIAKGQLPNFLKQNNIPTKIVMDHIKPTLGWQHYVLGRYGKDIQVSGAEVQAELSRIEKNKQKNQVLLSEIVIPYNTPGQEAEAKRKANEISAKLRSGAPFPIMAQQYSHSASAARGDDVGWVNLDGMDPELKKVVQSTRRGEVSNPVATNGGYRIVGIRDRHGVGSLGESVEYVSFQQIEFKFPMFEGEAGMEETYIKANNIRKSAKSCSSMKKMTDGRPRITNTMVERVQAENMHPDLAKILNKLAPGNCTDPMRVDDGLIMFMMCNKDVVKPHEPDAKEIKAMLRDKKAAAIFDRELRSIRSKAFVDIKL